VGAITIRSAARVVDATRTTEFLLKECAMPRVVITAEVENLDAWEKGFRSHGDLFKQMAVSTMEYATVAGNRVAVCGETQDLDAYMRIFNSPATAEAMVRDGVKRETVQMFVLDKALPI
jgi:hypothetical protein